jgi:glutamate 5-kinase
MPADLTGTEDSSGDTTACLRDARRLIVKIGSALLVDETTGQIRLAQAPPETLARQDVTVAQIRLPRADPQ